MISLYLSSINADTGLTPADLRARLLGDRSSVGRVFLERAAARAEIPARDWPDGLTTLPSDLVRHDLVMTLKPVPDARVLEIVDDLWLPLVQERVRGCLSAAVRLSASHTQFVRPEAPWRVPTPSSTCTCTASTRCSTAPRD